MHKTKINLSFAILYICMFATAMTTQADIASPSDTTIPVVFIHKGDSYYLKDSLWQAKQYNSRVILIGDEANDRYPEVEHYNIHDYFEAAEDFVKVYTHIAENPYHFELFCFQRWYILKTFMEKHNIERSFYCDSDVMLYCDVTQEDKNNFSQYDIAMMIAPHKVCSGHVSFLSKSGLQDFCTYTSQYYQDEKIIADWIAWFNGPRRQKGHGVCDMTLLTKYWETKRTKVGNLRDIIDDAAFDQHLGADENGCYNMEQIEREGKKIILKTIEWINNVPYAYHKKLNKLIRFKGLHCQGGRKLVMEQCRMPRKS